MYHHESRTSVFIDKFSVTFSVPNEERSWQNAAEALSHLCQQGFLLEPARGGRVYEHYHAAWHAVIPVPNGPSARCLIQVFPKSSGKGFLRLEWNPARLQRAQFRQIIEVLAACIPDIETWWRTAKVTRADVTFDLPQLKIERLLTFSSSAATIGIKRKENGGSLNAFVLGSETSIKRLTIYDKAFERAIRHSRDARRTRRVFRTCTRVEFRIRKLGTMQEIEFIKNPLSSFSIVSVADAYAQFSEESWIRFIRRCESVGAQTALSVLADRKRRQRYRDVLEKRCTPRWYNKEILWAEAKIKIAELLFLQ